MRGRYSACRNRVGRSPAGGSKSMLAKGDRNVGRPGIRGVLKCRAICFIKVPRNHATIRYCAFLPLGWARLPRFCILLKNGALDQEIEHRRPGRVSTARNGGGGLPPAPVCDKHAFERGPTVTSRPACHRFVGCFKNRTHRLWNGFPRLPILYRRSGHSPVRLGATDLATLYTCDVDESRSKITS